MLVILILSIISIVTIALSVFFIVKGNNYGSSPDPSPSPGPGPSPSPTVNEVCIGKEVSSCDSISKRELNNDLYRGIKCAMSYKGTFRNKQPCVALNKEGKHWSLNDEFGSCGEGTGKCVEQIGGCIFPVKGSNGNCSDINTELPNSSMEETIKPYLSSIDCMSSYQSNSEGSFNRCTIGKNFPGSSCSPSYRTCAPVGGKGQPYETCRGTEVVDCSDIKPGLVPSFNATKCASSYQSNSDGSFNRCVSKDATGSHWDPRNIRSGPEYTFSKCEASGYDCLKLSGNQKS